MRAAERFFCSPISGWCRPSTGTLTVLRSSLFLCDSERLSRISKGCTCTKREHKVSTQTHTPEELHPRLMHTICATYTTAHCLSFSLSHSRNHRVHIINNHNTNGLIHLQYESVYLTCFSGID